MALPSPKKMSPGDPRTLAIRRQTFQGVPQHFMGSLFATNGPFRRHDGILMGPGVGNNAVYCPACEPLFVQALQRGKGAKDCLQSVLKCFSAYSSLTAL